MRVEIELQDNLPEPFAKIFTKEIDDSIQALAERIKHFKQKDILLLWHEDSYQVVKLEEIQLIRVENQQTVLYTKDQHYYSSLRLYQIEEDLNQSFIRISKSAIVNIKHVTTIEPSFNSTMVIKLQNGAKDYISRKYLPDFKKFLGM